MNENLDDWQETIQEELTRAERARGEGKEGMARVCARRAAGYAVREYFRRSGVTKPGITPYGLLEVFRELPELPMRIRNAALHLTTRVTPDLRLPVEADLIQESRILIGFLFQEQSDNQEEA